MDFVSREVDLLPSENIKNVAQVGQMKASGGGGDEEVVKVDFDEAADRLAEDGGH